MYLFKIRLTSHQYIGGLVLGFLAGYLGLYYFLHLPKPTPDLFKIFMFLTIFYFAFIVSCRLRDAGMYPWLAIAAILLGPIGLVAVIFYPSEKD